MDDIPYIVQASLSVVLAKKYIPKWWNQKMWWSGWSEDHTPAEMWKKNPMAVILRIESYLEPQVYI